MSRKSIWKTGISKSEAHWPMETNHATEWLDIIEVYRSFIPCLGATQKVYISGAFGICVRKSFFRLVIQLIHESSMSEVRKNDLVGSDPAKIMAGLKHIEK